MIRCMPAYDPMSRRRSIRRGPHERGAWIYLSAEELRKAGIDPKGSPPAYRTWGRGRGSMLVRLYRQD